MPKKNRFNKRQEKRCRVYFSTLKSDEVAEYNPETKQVEVTKMVSRDAKFQTPFLEMRPNFSDLYQLDAGSAAEKNYLDARMRQGLPRYSDPKTGMELG